MQLFKILAIVAVVACSTGCQKVKQALGISEWDKSETSTAMDGTTIHATRSFQQSGNPSRIDADVSCKQNEKRVSITLSSYDTKASGSGEQAGSDFVMGNGGLAGRVKTANADPIDAGLFFALNNHSNVATWAFAAETIIDYSCQSVIHAFQKRGEALTDDKRAQFCVNRETALPIAHEAIRTPNADMLDIRQFNEGAKLKAFLPIVVELSNAGGTVEMVIPADDKNINAVVAACDGPKVEYFKPVPPPAPKPDPVAAPEAAGSAAAPAGGEPPEDDVPEPQSNGGGAAQSH